MLYLLVFLRFSTIHTLLMNTCLRYLFFKCIVRPIILLILGIHVRHRHRLPSKGPAILVANHNSHLDTMVLMSLFPMRQLKTIRPVAAADYFLKSKRLSWFAQSIIGIIPIPRKIRRHQANPLSLIQKHLTDGDIIIYFPEGSRGEPEKMSPLKAGIAHLAENNPKLPIIPIFMHGLGKALPKNEALLVPFVLDVVIGQALYWQADKKAFMAKLSETLEQLKQELTISDWT